MKNTAQILTFKLSVLATLMLCVTANNASDIEIYKAPNASDGKARVMLNLDNSTYMSGEPSGTTGSSTIENDFGSGLNCSPAENNSEGNKKYFTGTQTQTYPSGASYTYNTSYCTISKTAADASAKRAAIENLCALVTATEYHCYSRLTQLKRGVLDVINDATLGSGISVGLSFFPKHTATPADGSATIKRPVPLAWYNPTTGAICDAPYTGCTDGRAELSRIVAGLRISRTSAGERNVRVAQGYGASAYSLLTNSDDTDLSSDQCSGYGIFSLTSGMPDDDLMYGNHSSKGESAATQINRVMQTGFNLTSTQCSDSGSSTVDRSWQCIGHAADLLAASKAKLAMPVKSVVVSFGTGFAFSPDMSPYNPDLTTAAMVQKVIADISKSATSSEKALYNAKRDAAISGVKGGGGYVTIDENTSLAATIIRFIEEVGEVDIPYITTGAPTIPQDPLNPVLVQSNAYFSQFKPTPNKLTTEGSQLWAGNMKKYRVNNVGRLIGKNNVQIGAAEEKEDVTDDLGRLITGTHDYWAPNVDSDPDIAKGDETVWGSELYARMGGVKSQLPLSSVVASVTVDNRKLLTNRVITSGVASGTTSLSQVERADWAASDPKRTDLMTLLDLRQLGAVMHSSPLLLSNEGKMTYNEKTKQLESSGRDDYVLFGSTQGILHVVKADDYTSSNGGGKEVFAFVPNEMIENQSKAFLTPDQTTDGTAALFYGIDAPWTAHTEYVPKSDGTLTVGTGKTTTGSTTLQGKQWVYGGLRMGGRSYYALDLSNMNNPSLKFHINPDAATSGPLSYMGQSWSKPKMAWVNWNGTRKLVMFVGGGYDAGGVTGSTAGINSKANNGGYERDTYDQTNGIGAGVYMFDASTGGLLWWASNNASSTTAATTNSGVIALKDANMKYSVVSDIKTADRDNDGLVDHLYFGDLGGQVFRIDLNNKASTIGAFVTRSTRILNMHASGGTSPRFYAAPSFSIFKDSGSGNLFAAISLGSGNLSHPLAGYDSGRENDALYTIYDKDVARPDLAAATSMNTQDTAVGASGSLVINELTMANRFQQSAENMTALVAPYASSAGWYYKLQGGTKIQHEKIFYSPTVIDYDLYVSSYDSSRLGLTGECGGGVQGVSKVQIFCMPFGQCSAANYADRTSSNYSDDHGPGIQNHAIASGGDGTTRLVGGALLSNNLNDTYATRVKLIAQRWYER
ncbi:hypothetical protein AMQ28_09865 [Acinetobacter sp. TTH0-4]|uniref:hypothetical protein n=1 Tax=Acinetobacter sp. TTH0-4 TaxID=1646498 RepID=UPI0006AE3390|nr:hypothetical protein [Acinetobacter sp. TTH0-4]ALD02629.1 hypothetical protein AMQ28_09865 [Acinetobacter sp. TTH0-4]